MEDLIYSAVHRSSKWASCLEVSRECSAELGRSERQVAFCSMLMQISIIKSTTEAKAPKTPTYISLKQNSLYAENVKSTALSAPAAMQLRMWAKNSLDNIQFIQVLLKIIKARPSLAIESPNSLASWVARANSPRDGLIQQWRFSICRKRKISTIHPIRFGFGCGTYSMPGNSSQLLNT